MKSVLRILPLVVLALASCKGERAAPYKGEGRLLVEGPAREVLAAPGGGAIAWLASPAQAKERGIHAPDHIYLGTATFSGGGAPIPMGADVPTLPGAFFFSPTGAHVGALTGWSFQRQSGTLVVGSVEGSSVRTVASKVSFFAFSKDGRWLGYVADGALRIERVEGGEAAEIAKEVATFELSPDASLVLARKKSMAGGALLLASASAGKEPQILGDAVSDYHWSPDGVRIAFTAKNEEGGNDLFLSTREGQTRKVGTGVPSFVFSPTGRHLAFLGDTSVRKQFGDLFLLEGEAKEATRIGETVTEFAFAPEDGRIAWLDGYDPQSRGGRLKWRRMEEGAKAEELGADVPSFVWSRDGNNLAFIRRIHQPVFSIDLFLAKLGGEASEAFSIAKGVFGYSFSKDSDRLFLRTECIRNGRACELYSVEVADPANTIRHIAGGIHTYEPDPGESVLMLTYARMDADAFDLGVIPIDGSAPVRMLDRLVLPGTRLLGGKEPRIAYAVIEKDRLGVYVADVPPFSKP